MSASDHLSSQLSYRGQHQPVVDEDDAYLSAGLHEMDRVYPDYYEHPEYYHQFHTQDPEANRYHQETLNAAMSHRGHPNRVTHMYRAVPKEVNTINTGDWVTPSRTYAKVHGEGALGGNYRILHAIVPAKALRATGDYAPEFGYAGPPVKLRRSRAKPT